MNSLSLIFKGLTVSINSLTSIILENKRTSINKFKKFIYNGISAYSTQIKAEIKNSFST